MHASTQMQDVAENAATEPASAQIADGWQQALGPSLESLEAVRAEFPDVICGRAICIVDRLEGGRENLERAGLSLSPIFTRDDFSISD